MLIPMVNRSSDDVSGRCVWCVCNTRVVGSLFDIACTNHRRFQYSIAKLMGCDVYLTLMSTALEIEHELAPSLTQHPAIPDIPGTVLFY